jgi:hypothetical protein
MMLSAWPKISFAESTPEWNDNLRKSGWTEVSVFDNSVRLWSHSNLRGVTIPGLVNYAIQVFAGKGCRTVAIHPNINTWSRSALPVGENWYRTSFYQIGFLAPKANTPGAVGKEAWTITATVSDVQECPGEKEE